MEPEINFNVKMIFLKNQQKNNSKITRNGGIWWIYHENVLNIHVKSDLKSGSILLKRVKN